MACESVPEHAVVAAGRGVYTGAAVTKAELLIPDDGGTTWVEYVPC